MTVELPLLAFLVSLAGLSGAAIYKAGVLAGRFDKHEDAIEQRVEKLESAQSAAVTRGELDARFEAVTTQLRELGKKMDRLLESH